MKIKPLSDRVLVRPQESQKQTKGGLALPDNAQKQDLRGEVLAVGPGRILSCGERTKMNIKVGDVVAWSAYVGTEFVLDDEKFFLVSEEELLGVLK